MQNTGLSRLLEFIKEFVFKWMLLMSQGVRVIPWKVLGQGDDNSESINTLKVYCP